MGASNLINFYFLPYIDQMWLLTESGVESLCITTCAWRCIFFEKQNAWLCFKFIINLYILYVHTMYLLFRPCSWLGGCSARTGRPLTEGSGACITLTASLIASVIASVIASPCAAQCASQYASQYASLYASQYASYTSLYASQYASQVGRARGRRTPRPVGAAGQGLNPYTGAARCACVRACVRAFVRVCGGGHGTNADGVGGGCTVLGRFLRDKGMDLVGQNDPGKDYCLGTNNMSFSYHATPAETTAFLRSITLFQNRAKQCDMGCVSHPSTVRRWVQTTPSRDTTSI